MNVSRVWRSSSFSAIGDFPSYPCPQCGEGRLKIDTNSFCSARPTHSEARSVDEAERLTEVERFSARMVCDDTDCGEIAHAIGDGRWIEVGGDDDFENWHDVMMYTIRSIFPAPPIIPRSEKYPKMIQRQLDLLAGIFLAGDLPACASKLRLITELLLDDQGVARHHLTRKGVNIFSALDYRISEWIKGVSVEYSPPLHALRLVGNLGTHGTPVADDAFFDGCDVLHDVLQGIYEEKSIRLKVNRLVSTKGKYE